MFYSYWVQCSIHVKRINFVNLVPIIYSPLDFYLHVVSAAARYLLKISIKMVFAFFFLVFSGFALCFEAMSRFKFYPF